MHFEVHLSDFSHVNENTVLIIVRFYIYPHLKHNIMSHEIKDTGFQI